MVVGARGADPNGLQDAGRTYVVFGKVDTEAVLLSDVAEGIGGFVLDGEAAGDASGHAVSGAGDVDGDGLTDVIIGAPRYHYCDGRTYVVFGRTDTTPTSLSQVAVGVGGFAVLREEEDQQLGWAVAGTGDMNGDGFDDVLLVRAFCYSGYASQSAERDHLVLAGFEAATTTDVERAGESTVDPTAKVEASVQLRGIPTAHSAIARACILARILRRRIVPPIHSPRLS